MKKEFVIVSANSVFKAPQNMQEAEDRLKALRGGIVQLETTLRDKHVSHPQTGERLTTQQYFEWKREVRSVLARKTREAGYLKSWMKLQGSVPLAPQQVKAEAAFRMLWRCGQLLHRLSDEGVDFTPEERQLVADIEDFTGLKADQLLEEARACMQGGSENVFQFGALIAQATRDDQDLAVLTREWERVNAQTPRNEVLIAKCAEVYVRLLGYFGRFEDAIAVARSLDQTQRDAAYAWSTIAEHSGDSAVLEYTRALGRNIPAGQREWLFLGLYSFFGEQEDADLATSNPESEQLIGRRLGWFKVLTVKEYAGWGRLQEAHAVFQRLNSPEDRVHALACIVGESEDKDEVHNLMSMLDHYKPAKLTTMKRVAAVLAQHGYGDRVRKMLDSMSTWYLRCAGYSVLARFMQDDAADLLERAEQALTAASLNGGTEEGQTLYSLAYAQATNGRMAKAVRTARVIKERSARCMTLLLLNALSREDSIPEFLEEML
ncbi:MAG: hypothetical protein PHC70_01265 [Patescibacteria group bacterium]|nr:hypothetical protein [Patescibacteria group bacterium]